MNEASFGDDSSTGDRNPRKFFSTKKPEYIYSTVMLLFWTLCFHIVSDCDQT
jgi:hypothetical protein